MARPYSVDLRQRIVRAVESGTTCCTAAARFDVSVSFVAKLMHRWRDHGTLVPDPCGRPRKSGLAPHSRLITHIVQHEGGLTLEELRLRLAAEGIISSRATLCRFLKSEGVVLKRRYRPRHVKPSRPAGLSRSMRG